MKRQICDRCGKELRQLTHKETGAVEEPYRLIPYWYCKNCNRTQEEK